MQRHYADFLVRIGLVIVHDQADMLQKSLQIFKLLQRFNKLLEVFQPPWRFGRLVVLPHFGIAALVQKLFRQ